MARFVLVGEDQCHWQTVRCWTDTLLRSSVAWLREQATLDSFRTWEVDQEARQAGLEYLKLGSGGGFGKRSWRAHGAFARYGSLPDAKATADRLLRAQAITPTVDAVFLCRDTDDEPGRREAAQRCREQGHPEGRDWPFEIVLAIASPEMEAWRIAVWRAATEAEKERLKHTEHHLGFNPVHQPTRLSSSPRSKAESKAVARELQIGEAWRETSGEDLTNSRNKELGLADFVTDVLSLVVPLFE